LEEALDNAEDALAAWPAHVEDEFINTPSKHHLLEHLRVDLCLSHENRVCRDAMFPITCEGTLGKTSIFKLGMLPFK